MKCPKCGGNVVELVSRLEVSHFIVEDEDGNESISESEPIQFWNEGPIVSVQCAEFGCRHKGSPEEFGYTPDKISGLSNTLRLIDRSTFVKALLKGWKPKILDVVKSEWIERLSTTQSEGDLVEEYVEGVLGKAPGETLLLSILISFYEIDAEEFLSKN